jgi:hypothetical protein
MRIEVIGKLLLLLPFLLARAEAATYYVSTQGSDSNSGTSAQPFRTITRGYSLAAPGDTILVMPGTYTDYRSGWGLHLGRSGTASSPIVLRSSVPGAAVIDGQNASDRNVALYIDGHYNVVDGFEIKNAPKGGLTIWSGGNRILNCQIHHNGNLASSSTEGQDGIYSDTDTSGNIYTANYIHHNGRAGSSLDHGLYLCGQDELVNNNIILANTGNGIQVAGYSTVRNLKIYNNVLARNGKSGIILWQSLSGVDIRNNVFYYNGRYAINSYDAHGSAVTVNNNLSFGNASGHFDFIAGGSTYAYTLGTALYTEPGFVNGNDAGFDAHVAASSPARLAGANLFSTFATDMAGVSRPAGGPWDLGVYEHGVAATNPVPSTVSITAPVSTAVIGSANPGVFTFTRTGNTSSPLTVNFSLGGPAVKWNDYYRVPEGDMPVAVTIPAGAASCTMNVVARDNQTGSNPQFVTITLSPDPSYQVGSPGSATLTIVSTTTVTPSSTSVSIRKVAEGMNLSWNSVAGKTYRVACKGDLKNPWTDLSGNITATGSSTSWTDTTANTANQRFYSVYSTN